MTAFLGPDGSVARSRLPSTTPSSAATSRPSSAGTREDRFERVTRLLRRLDRSSADPLRRRPPWQLYTRVLHQMSESQSLLPCCRPPSNDNTCQESRTVDGPYLPSRRALSRRSSLHILDACLTQLEEANERGDQRLSASLAARLDPHLPGIDPEMLVADAMNLVFKQQQQYLDSPDEGDRNSLTSSPVAPTNTPGRAESMSRPEALVLTERIRTQGQQVCYLLWEAHQRRAWAALGYASWERYIRQEFGMSRSRSYDLLDQARVLSELQSAARLRVVPRLSPYATMQIKADLGSVLAEVRRRTSGASSEDRKVIVVEVVNEARRRGHSHATASTPTVRPSIRSASESRLVKQNSLSLRDAHICDLHRAVVYLASLPPPAECLREADRNVVPSLAIVKQALEWLMGLQVCLASPDARWNPQASGRKPDRAA
jgi:hypothetical protein